MKLLLSSRNSTAGRIQKVTVVISAQRRAKISGLSVSEDGLFIFLYRAGVVLGLRV